MKTVPSCSNNNYLLEIIELSFLSLTEWKQLICLGGYQEKNSSIEPSKGNEGRE